MELRGRRICQRRRMSQYAAAVGDSVRRLQTHSSDDSDLASAYELLCKIRSEWTAVDDRIDQVEKDTRRQRTRSKLRAVAESEGKRSSSVEPDATGRTVNGETKRRVNGV